MKTETPFLFCVSVSRFDCLFEGETRRVWREKRGSTSRCAELMRRNAWISNAITQEIDQPKYLRTVRENARNILTRQGALGALEAAGIVSGSLVLFADFANGQDDAEQQAELMELVLDSRASAPVIWNAWVVELGRANFNFLFFLYACGCAYHLKQANHTRP
jgi:hypothetical protein